MSIVLPVDLWVTIFDKLNLDDIMNVSFVCKAWYSPLTYGHIWARIYKKKFGDDTPSFKEPKVALQKRLGTERAWKKGQSIVNRVPLNACINVMEINQDETEIVVGCDDGKAWLIPMKTSSLSPKPITTHSQLVWTAHYLDSNTIISSGYDCKIKLWDIAKNCLKGEIANKHVGGIWEVIHRDGKIYTTGIDGYVRCIDLETSTELSSLSVSLSFVWNLLPMWSHNALVASAQNSRVYFIDFKNNSIIKSFQADEQLLQIKHSPAIFPHYILGGNSQGLLQLWDIRKFGFGSNGSYASAQSSNDSFCFKRIPLQCSPIRDIAFDTTKCVVANQLKTLRLFDTDKVFSSTESTLSHHWSQESLDAFALALTKDHLFVGTKAGEFIKHHYRSLPSPSSSISFDSCNFM